MQLSKIKNRETYLEFPFQQIRYQPVVALTLPPGMLAIATALEAILDRLEEYEYETEDFEFAIKGFKEEIGEVWELTIVAEDDYYDYSSTFNVRVIRNVNDYSAEIELQK